VAALKGTNQDQVSQVWVIAKSVPKYVATNGIKTMLINTEPTLKHGMKKILIDV